MVCSTCGESGHNRRTCGNNSSGGGLDTSIRRSDYSTNMGINYQSKSSDSKNASLQTSYKQINKASESTANKQKSEKSYSELSSASKIAQNSSTKNPTKEIKKMLSKHTKDQDEELQLMIHLSNITALHDNKKTHMNINCDGCNTCRGTSKEKSRTDRYAKTCGICHQPNHNRATCPLLEPERLKSKAKEKSGPSWMTPDAQQRLRKGPTEKDGSGHIYMYKLMDPKTEDERNLFKIGLSRDHPERRIKHQENKNGEVYQLLFSQETPYRYLAENTIHLHLKDVRRPRDEGDGKTEWFVGSRLQFEDAIKKTIREVKFSQFD